MNKTYRLIYLIFFGGFIVIFKNYSFGNPRNIPCLWAGGAHSLILGLTINLYPVSNPWLYDRCHFILGSDNLIN